MRCIRLGTFLTPFECVTVHSSSSNGPLCVCEQVSEKHIQQGTGDECRWCNRETGLLTSFFQQQFAQSNWPLPHSCHRTWRLNAVCQHLITSPLRTMPALMTFARGWEIRIVRADGDDGAGNRFTARCLRIAFLALTFLIGHLQLKSDDKSRLQQLR
jgi:hypothetical protein